MSDSSHSHDAHGEHGLAHVMPIKVLLTVGGILLLLTAVTVWVTAVDLGRNGNLLVAMLIATIKAALVCGYFMHLKYDRPFNALVFFCSVLFVGLFISIAMLDKSEYEDDIQQMELLEAQ